MFIYTCMPTYVHVCTCAHMLATRHAGRLGGSCADTSSSWICACPAGTASWLSSLNPTALELPVNSSGFSLSLWVRPNASMTAGFRSFVQCRDPTSEKPGFALSFDSSRDRAQYSVFQEFVLRDKEPIAMGAAKEQARARPYRGGWTHYALVHTRWVSPNEPSNATNSSLNTSANASRNVLVNASSNASANFSGNISRPPEPNVWLYRDGVLVATAYVPYLWSNNLLDCSVGAGNALSAQHKFSGDALFFYYWNDALTKEEVSYTRVTNLPQHTSENVHVYGALGSECKNINECELGLHQCTKPSVCIDNLGSYLCSDPLPAEFEEILSDDDECSMHNESCPENTTCANMLGSFICLCSEGTAYNISFTGSDPIYLPDETRLGAHGLSLSLWVRSDAVEDRLQSLVECQPPVIGAPYFSVAYNSLTTSFVYMLSESQVASVDSSAASVMTNVSENSTANASASDARHPVWVNFAMVHNKTGHVSMYVDGVLAATALQPYTFKDTNAAECTIGSSVRPYLSNFVGWMRGVYVWAQALNSTQVQRLLVPLSL
jgi:hypothetical protein